MPLLREVIMGFGMCSASANCLNSLLSQSNEPSDISNRDGYTSNAAIVAVGGAQESRFAVANTYKIVLRRRKGFVRIALKNGAALVPAISFGETSVFDVIEHEPGSRFHNFQESFKRYTDVALLDFYGRHQWLQRWLPRRHPITTVIGKIFSFYSKVFLILLLFISKKVHQFLQQR